MGILPLPTEGFVARGDVGDDSFTEVPSNAQLSIFEVDTVGDVVVIPTEPKLSSGDPSGTAEVAVGELMVSDGPVNLLIDMIGRPMTAVVFAGGRRRGRRRVRRRMP